MSGTMPPFSATVQRTSSLIARFRISAAAETICYKCLEKKPKDRYGSATALVEDLELALADRPLRTPLRRSVRSVIGLL